MGPFQGLATVAHALMVSPLAILIFYIAYRMSWKNND